MTDSLLIFGDLGPGVPLYFYFTKFLILCMLVMWLIAGIACLIGNIVANSSSEWNDPSFVTHTSLGGYGRDYEAIYWQAILHIISGVSILIMYVIFTHRMIGTSISLDVLSTTPADFTILVKNLPKNYDAEDFKQYFIQNGRWDGKECELMYITPVYDISALLDVYRQLAYYDSLKLKHQNAPKQSKCNLRSCITQERLPSLKKIDKKIAKLETSKAKILQNQNHKFTTNMAFITFRTQLETRYVLERWHRNWAEQLKDSITIQFKKNPRYCYNKRYITVTRAPEPNDIYWENLSIGRAERMKRIAITYTAVLALIGCSFGVVYGLDQAAHTTQGFISIVISLVIVVFNSIISYVIISLTKYERYHTWTNYLISVVNKLSFFLIINSGLIPLLNNLTEEDWHKSGGLADTMFWVLLANALLTPVFYIIDTHLLYIKLKKHRLEKTAAEGKALTINQAKANSIYEGVPFDLKSRTSHLIKTLIITVFYAPLLPLGIFIGLISFTLDYWASKFMLVTFYSRPRRIGDDLFEVLKHWIPLALLIHAVGVFVFYREVLGYLNIFGIAYMIVAGLLILVPVGTLLNLKAKESPLTILEKLLKDDQNQNDYTKQLAYFDTVILS